ncbi:META domain-containing protein [Knoellia locipacati]|uniref:META domain-containing protein n=1 Tax=Knoellia locipacati TaxID=882824 RepID=UPI00384E66EF
MRLQAKWVALAAVVVFVVVGGLYAVRLTLVRAADDGAGWLDSLQPVQGQWVSRTGFAYDGSTPWTVPVNLSVEGDQLQFDVGCNRMTATVTVEEHRLRSEQGVAATRMGCPPDIAAHEAWLAALVADRAQVQLKGSTEGDMFSLNTDAGWIGFIRR